jgi:hypothetical protein
VDTRSKPKNIDDLNNARPKASRYFMNKRKTHLKAKIKKLETNSRIKKNIRDLYSGSSDFKKSYQPRTNRVRMIKMI